MDTSSSLFFLLDGKKTNRGTSTRSRPQWKRGICLGVILRSDGCLIPVMRVQIQFIHITSQSVKITGIFIAQEEVRPQSGQSHRFTYLKNIIFFKKCPKVTLHWLYILTCDGYWNRNTNRKTKGEINVNLQQRNTAMHTKYSAASSLSLQGFCQK